MIETEDINRVYFANQWWHVTDFEWHPEHTAGQTWVSFFAFPFTDPYPDAQDTTWEVMIPLNQLVAIADQWHEAR